MADIRNAEVQTIGQRTAQSALTRARATSSDRAQDKITAEIKYNEYVSDLNARSQQQDLAVWVIRMIDNVNSAKQDKKILTLKIKIDGSLYYHDKYNSKYELPNKAKECSYYDNMDLQEFLSVNF